MIWRVLADLLVLLHLAFVAFVVLGGLLALRWRSAPWVHLPAAAWGAIVAFFGWICPLTPLEIAWRVRGGEAGYSGGFVAHYLLPMLYPEGLTRGVQVFLGAFVLAVNVAIYTLVWRRRKKPATREA